MKRTTTPRTCRLTKNIVAETFLRAAHVGKIETDTWAKTLWVTSTCRSLSVGQNRQSIGRYADMCACSSPNCSTLVTCSAQTVDVIMSAVLRIEMSQSVWISWTLACSCSNVRHMQTQKKKYGHANTTYAAVWRKYSVARRKLQETASLDSLFDNPAGLADKGCWIIEVLLYLYFTDPCASFQLLAFTHSIQTSISTNNHPSGSVEVDVGLTSAGGWFCTLSCSLFLLLWFPTTTAVAVLLIDQIANPNEHETS